MSLDHNTGRPLKHLIAPTGNAITTADLSLPQTRIVRHRRSHEESSEADRGALAAEGPFWPGRFATALLMLAVVGSFVIERPANLILVADKDTDTVASSSRTKQDDQDETARPTGSRVVASITPVPTSQGQSLAASESVAPLPSGRVYGAENTNSRITLRIHRPTQVIVSGRRGQLLLQRSLQRDDTYRAPSLPDLTVTTQDAGAVEVMFDGKSIGFLGKDGASVQRVPLRRFVPAAPLPAISSNEADNLAMAAQEAVERTRAAKESATRADEARAVAWGLQAMAAEEAVERKRSAELSAIGADEARAVAARGLSAREETADQAEPAQSADQAKAATDVADQTAGLNEAVGETRTVPSTAGQAIAREEAAEQPTAVQETADQPTAVTNTADQAIAENGAADPPAASQQGASQPAASESQGRRRPRHCISLNFLKYCFKS